MVNIIIIISFYDIDVLSVLFFLPISHVTTFEVAKNVLIGSLVRRTSVGQLIKRG
jgi:hypothetical protein